MLTDAQLDKLEHEISMDLCSSTDVLTVISCLRAAKRQILAYEEALSQIAGSQHIGGVASRGLARNVLAKEF